MFGAAKTTTTSPWSNINTVKNLLCVDDLWSEIKGKWTYDDVKCTFENTDSDDGNVQWLGSDDGHTPDSNYDCDCFSMTVVLEIHDGGENAGVMFRTGECHVSYNEGPTYYVGLDPGSDEVVFRALDNGVTELFSRSMDEIYYGTEYTLTVTGCGDTYSVFLNGQGVLKDVSATDFSSGSIGLRTHVAPTMFHHVEFECMETTSSSPTPQATTYDPTTGPTVSPSPEPTVSPSPEPTQSVFSSEEQEKCCLDGWSQGTDCQGGCGNCACSDGSRQCGCIHLDNIPAPTTSSPTTSAVCPGCESAMDNDKGSDDNVARTAEQTTGETTFIITWAEIAAVAGCVIFLAVVVSLGAWYLRRRKQGASASAVEMAETAL